MKVKLSWTERFFNWFPYNTKLYIRGERGKSVKEIELLWKELAEQLKPFFDELKEEAYLEGFNDCHNANFERYDYYRRRKLDD